MASTTKSLDGNFSLNELQQTLTTQENLGFKHLTGLKKRDDPPAANIATFDDDTGVDPKPPLVLVPIKAGDDINTITAAQQAKGKALLFQSNIFIAGADAKVAAFR
jgi:hypothetical protein